MRMTMCSTSEEHQLQDWENGHNLTCVPSEQPQSPSIAERSHVVYSLEQQLELCATSTDAASAFALLESLAQETPFTDEDANLALLLNAARLYVAQLVILPLGER